MYYVKIRQKSIDSRALHSANHHKARFRPYYIEALSLPICYHARAHSCTPSIKICGCVCKQNDSSTLSPRLALAMHEDRQI